MRQYNIGITTAQMTDIFKISGNDKGATFDRKHLIDPPEVSARSGLLIGTPGDILNELQGYFGPEQQWIVSLKMRFETQVLLNDMAR